MQPEFDFKSASNGGAGKPKSLGGRLGSSLFFCFFLGMGLLFIALMLREAANELATRRWTATPARVLDSGVRVADGGAEYPYQPFVSYAYRFGGQDRVSQSIGNDFQRASDYSQAQMFIGAYGKGQQVTCYVNPADPSQAVLRHASPWIMLILPLPLLFVAIGAGGLYFLWKPGGAPSNAVERPISDAGKQQQSSGPGFIVIFFLAIFFLAGFAVAFFVLILPIAHVIRARDWVRVPCVVERSQVIRHDSHDSKHGPTYNVDILYRYAFRGQTFRSSRYQFLGGSSGGYSGKQAIVAAYPSGLKTACWVDPAAPASAVLNRGLTSDIFGGLLSIPFMAVGAGGLFFARKARTAAAPGSAAFGALGSPAVSAPLSDFASVATVPAPAPARESADGPWALLKPIESPAKNLATLTIAAIAWNGVTAFGFYMMVHEMNGQLKWAGTSGMLVFFGIFFLIGAVLLVVAAGQALALANPRPKLRLSTDRVALGARATLQWELRGNAVHVRRLKIVLEGVEAATHEQSSGSDHDRSQVTERATFYRQAVFETADPAAMAQGQAEVALPRAAMHSFTAPHNRVYWQLRVQGEIPHWPDVDEAFGVEVAPLAIDAPANNGEGA